MLRSPTWYLVVLTCGALFAGTAHAADANAARRELNRPKPLGQGNDARQAGDGQSGDGQSGDWQSNAPSASSHPLAASRQAKRPSNDTRADDTQADASWHRTPEQSGDADATGNGGTDDTPSAGQGAVAGGTFTVVLNESEPNNVIGDAQALDSVTPSTIFAYEVHAQIAPNQDVDVFEIFAVKGAVYGFAAIGAGSPDTIITLYNEAGDIVAANDDHNDMADRFPGDSPFIGGTSDLDSALIWIAPDNGSYFAEVRSFQGGSGGEYAFNVRARIPKLRSGTADEYQTFVLDFGGEQINPQQIFGQGPNVATLSPFASFLQAWYPQFDENNPPSDAFRDDVIDAVVDTVRENLDDLRKQSLNGDRDDDSILGNFDYELFIVRDESDTDIFGGKNISRIIIGGTQAELGLSGMTFSPSIDPGNFALEETGIVLLDRLSLPTPDVSSINSIQLGGSATTADAVGNVVGNLVSKIIGQMVGNFPTDGDNAVASIMDEGGSGATMMTFDEVAPGTVNGTVIGDSTLSYTPGGSESATVGGGLFSESALISPPYVQGSTGGTLTVSFAEPVLGVGYRFALKNSVSPATPVGPLANVSQIDLLDAGNAVVATSSAGITVSQFGVGEGANLALAAGAPVVMSARITFDDTLIDADTFAVDTLTTFATATFVSRNLAGAGDDNTLGTADDTDPDFVTDTYLPASQVATGKQLTDVMTAFGLSSGTNPVKVCTSVFFDEKFDAAVVFEDVEDFLANNNVGPGNGQWRLTNVCDSSLPGHSLPTSMYFGNDADGECSYNVGNSDGWVTAEIGEVSGEADVSFQYFLETEADLVNYDIARFEVATDGVNFELLATNEQGAAPNRLEDPSGGWRNILIEGICPQGYCPDLRLRWRFSSGDGNSNDFRGFYVDDVSVCEHVNCIPTRPRTPMPENLAKDQATSNLVLSWNGQASGGNDIDGITFDEVAPDTNIDNTQIDIVRFEFGPGDATVVAGNEFFDTNFLFPPFLRGPIAGELMLNFNAPVNSVGFSFGFPDGTAVDNAATMTLFDGDDMPIRTETADLEKSQFTIAEGEFFTDSDIPINSVRITFDNPNADVFYVDNVRYSPLLESGPSSATAAGGFAASRFYVPPAAAKVSAEIKRNQRRKAEILARKPNATRADLLKAGIGGESFDAEECAMYVSAQLTAQEIAELKTQGIDVNSWAWVPPVQGRHPLGFYLAKVDYDAMGQVQADARILRLSSTERLVSPSNDLSATLVGADDLKAGFVAGQMLTGAGVRVAVADSGLDLTHPDIPEPAEAFDVTDGSNPASWSTDVANKVTSHGTHVTGTVLGSGELSDGRYAGAAPDATLYFYKIGNDNDSNASISDIIEAINRASEVGCHIFNMSYGGFGGFMDGSDPCEQAIDAATENGMLSFISAGNDGGEDNHFARVAFPDVLNDAGSATVINFNEEDPTLLAVYLYFLWSDGTPGDDNIELVIERTNEEDPEPQVSCDYYGASPRGTEAMECEIILGNVPPEAFLSYNVGLINSDDDSFPTVHTYAFSTFNEDGFIFFPNTDDAYKVGSPSVADTAISVGAWVHREFWINADGDAFTFGQTPNTLATFSSRGPRIDGVLKPDIVSPGTATISTRDRDVLTEPDPVELWIDDDGIPNTSNDDDSNYLVSQGTSMASPYAAGSAALLKEANPSWSPTRLRLALTSNASQALAPNSLVGYGLIDLPASLQTNCGTTFDVFWGPAGASPIKICSDLSQNFCPAPPMDFGEDYEWYVVENRPVGSIASQTWSYSTGCVLAASIPSNCEYETGQPSPPNDGGNAQGRDQVVLLLDTSSLTLRPSDFSVSDDSGNAPFVNSIQQSGATVTLNLSGPLNPGWSIIALGGCETAVGYFPVEINDDGTMDYDDVLSLIDVLDGASGNAPRSDLDRNGSVEPEDLLRAIDLLNGGGAYESFFGAVQPDCPTLEDEE